MTTAYSFTRRLFLFLSILCGFATMIPEEASATSGAGDIGVFEQAVSQAGTGGAKWKQFLTKIKSFAVILLMVMVVIAALMAAMQQTKWAVNVGIAAIILFGGTYVLAVVYEGFQ